MNYIIKAFFKVKDTLIEIYQENQEYYKAIDEINKMLNGNVKKQINKKRDKMKKTNPTQIRNKSETKKRTTRIF